MVINYLRRGSPQASLKGIANTFDVAHAEWWYKTKSTWQPTPSVWLCVPTAGSHSNSARSASPSCCRKWHATAWSNYGSRVRIQQGGPRLLRPLLPMQGMPAWTGIPAVLLQIDFFQNGTPQNYIGPDQDGVPEIHQHFQEHHAVEQPSCSQPQELVLDLEASRRSVLSTWWNHVPC